MGKPVTVDSDDLQTLLFATGVVKAVEAALRDKDRDPLYRKAEPEITEAHNRLASEWRRALREPPPEWDGTLTANEKKSIRAIGRGVIETADLPRLRSVREKGLVECGSSYAMSLWPDTSRIPLIQDRGVILVRLTERGQQALDLILEEEPLAEFAV